MIVAIEFNPIYFLTTVVLLFAEIIIEIYINDNWIRPYGGDFLVVILLYSLVRSFLLSDYRPVAVCVLLLAYATETLQYLHIVKLLNLEQNHFASIMIGTQFSWTDMLMYTLGIALVWLVEHRFRNNERQKF